MPTAAQPKEQLSALELKRKNTLGSGKIARPYTERAYICTITDIPWTPQDFDFGRYQVQPCAEGESFHVTTITAAISRMDHGDKRTTEKLISALDIADDICRMLNVNSGENGYVGVFVCESGPRPTEEELDTAHEKFRVFCEHFVEIADEEYQIFQSNRVIPGFARVAAKYLNVQKPYLQRIEQMIDCPQCAEQVRSMAIKCRHCGFVLDKQRHEKLHPNKSQDKQPGA